MTVLPKILPLLLTSLLVSNPARAEVRELLLEPTDAERGRTVPVKVYYVPTAKPQPVVLFSHGLGGSRNNSPYLGNHWAANGYVAVFMQHHGSDEHVWKDVRPLQRLKVLKEAAGARSALDRLHDVPFVIDQLERWNAEAGHPLKGRLDLQHIGLTGHSFGAVTTLGMLPERKSIGRQSFADERIDAFLPMSPQPGKGRSAERTFGEVKAPVLCMTGTEDDSLIDRTVTPEKRLEVYASFPSGDKYQIVFEGAKHLAFGEATGRLSPARNPKHHPAIQQISTRFWDAYLKGDKAAKAWLQSDAPREACDMDPKDVWEWK